MSHGPGRVVVATIVLVATAVACGAEGAGTTSPQPTSSIGSTPSSTPTSINAVPDSAAAPESSSSVIAQPVPPTSVPWTGPAPSLALDGVPPVSAPLVLSQYLNDVQLAVRNDVGEDVFGGAAANDADTAEMTITIYGTDKVLLSDAVDRIAIDERDRISVVETQYSVSDLEGFASEAQGRLDAAGIEAYVMIRWGLDAVDVNLVTPDGVPDSAIEERAAEALENVPAVISFSVPMTPQASDS